MIDSIRHAAQTGLYAMGRIPGALMVIPLFLGALLNTFCPQLLGIGGFTTGLFHEGIAATLGLFLFCMGAQINLGAAGTTMEKGLAILIGKLVAGIAIGLAVAFYAPDGTLFGLLPLAIIAAMTNSNSALYVALTKEFGSATDRGAVSVISLNDGPFFTLIILGAAGLADFPLISLVAILLPLVIGFVLGNLSEDIRSFLAPGETLLIPFMAIEVGSGIDFGTFAQAGPASVLLGLMTVVCSGGLAMACLYVVHRFHRRPPTRRSLIAGVCEGSTSGNAVATPAAVAIADHSYAHLQGLATAQVAGSTITTALLIPFAAAMVYRWQRRRGVLVHHDEPGDIDEARPVAAPPAKPSAPSS